MNQYGKFGFSEFVYLLGMFICAFFFLTSCAESNDGSKDEAPEGYSRLVGSSSCGGASSCAGGVSSCGGGSCPLSSMDQGQEEVLVDDSLTQISDQGELVNYIENESKGQKLIVVFGTPSCSACLEQKKDLVNIVIPAFASENQDSAPLYIYYSVNVAGTEEDEFLNRYGLKKEFPQTAVFSEGKLDPAHPVKVGRVSAYTLIELGK